MSELFYEHVIENDNIDQIYLINKIWSKKYILLLSIVIEKISSVSPNIKNIFLFFFQKPM